MSEGYRYDRVLLKLSGEALAGDVGYGIDPKVVDDLADQIATCATCHGDVGQGNAELERFPHELNRRGFPSDT